MTDDLRVLADPDLDSAGARDPLAVRVRGWYLADRDHPLWKAYLKESAIDLGYYLGGKLAWADDDGNTTDYDLLRNQQRAAVSINQIKPIVNSDIAHFIATDRKESGIVRLPDQFEEDAEFRSTEEGKKILAELKEQGLAHYLGHLRKTVANNQVSLRQDLEQQNIKADPLTFASKGEKEAMLLLAKYAKAGDEAQMLEQEELKKALKVANK